MNMEHKSTLLSLFLASLAFSAVIAQGRFAVIMFTCSLLRFVLDLMSVQLL